MSCKKLSAYTVLLAKFTNIKPKRTYQKHLANLITKNTFASLGGTLLEIILKKWNIGENPKLQDWNLGRKYGKLIGLIGAWLLEVDATILANKQTKYWTYIGLLFLSFFCANDVVLVLSM